MVNELGALGEDIAKDIPKTRVPAARNMRTDIRELDASYEFAIELPGYKKENINIELKDGYLVVSANMTDEKVEKSKVGKVVSSERTYGSISRSYYVGNKVKPQDIKATFDSGELLLTVKKPEEKKEKDSKIIIE